MKTRGNAFLLSVFIILSVSILFVGNEYKKFKVNEYTNKKYYSIAQSLSNEVSTLITEKKNATLAVAISYSKSEELKRALVKKSVPQAFLKKYSQQLKEHTDFKNVWLQLIDKNGFSLARSWSTKYGDNLSLIRDDVKSMNNKPQIRSSISVGRFDISFKSMVPIYDKELRYIGFIEVITHFNSIAKKIKQKGFEPVIAVDKKYRSQITKPFTNLFAGEHYIANINADKDLVKYIEIHGLKYFISPNENYIIDKNKNSIVVNYTLFDINKKPMANFLMFKPVKSLDLSSVGSIETTIKLFTLLALVLSSVFFYFVSKKDGIHLSTETHKGTAIFIALFLFLTLVYYMVVTWDYEKKKELFFNSYNQSINTDYQIIHKKFSTVANTMFHTVIDKPDIKELIAKAYESKTQKDVARDMLHKKLIEDYEFFKSYDIRQLHFHLNNNESFLRFHRPSKYGDNLTSVRSTVEWVNKNRTNIEGFEEGRIYNGFRYVFPLLQKRYTGQSRHLGSVEVSFSAHAIATEFALSHNIKAGFIIKEDVVQEKVFDEEQKNYTDSPFNGYLYEKSIKKQFEHAFMQTNIELLSDDKIYEASKNIQNGEVFSIESKDKNSIFTFIPFKNPVSHKVVAAMIIQKESYELSKRENMYILLLLSGISAILFIMLYIYKEFSSKEKFKLLSLKTQKILDAQKEIVIITSGQKIIDANKKFFEFFGFKDIEEFRTEHECICEYFKEDDRFFHLGKVKESENWVEVIKELPYREHIVSMADKNGNEQIFFISINDFDNNEILSFSNISDTMKEHFSLMEKVSRDKLTGAYNREYFDNNKDLLIQESSFKEVKLGVVIFDIDHFKDVNDTYGHNRGDEVLKHLVNLISKTIRGDDILIRWGGEEFLLLMNVHSIDELYNITENIRHKISKENFEEINRLTCSFGITLYDDAYIKDTIDRADKALYEAKENGRNQVVKKV